MRSPAFSIFLPAQPVPNLKRPVKGLLLDSCNILYDATGWSRWLLQVLRRLGVHTQYRSLFHVWEKDYLRAVNRGDCDWCEALRLFLQAVGLSRGQIEEVATTCEARRVRWESETRLLPGVKSTLCQIASAGARLAVVGDTDLSGRQLRQRLEKMGLPDILTSVVTSRDLGCVKPAPPCYSAALNALDVHASQAAFVGHDGEDLAGAARLGIQTVAFNSTDQVVADVSLAIFKDLVELVSLPIPRNMAG